jgi:hypothetical protein
MKSANAKAISDTMTVISGIRTAISNELAKSASNAYNMLDKSILHIMGKANNALRDAVLSVLGNLPGVAKEKYKMEVADNNWQASLLKLQESLLAETTLIKINTAIAAE